MTITPETKGDVGSPNAIVRQAIDGKVIVRTGRRIPGLDAQEHPSEGGGAADEDEAARAQDAT